MKRLVVLANRNQKTRRLGNEADEQGKKTCRHSLTSEHVAPACGHRPLCSGRDGCQSLAHLLDERLNVVAQDEEVNEVHNQLAEDDGKLVPRDQHTSDIGRCYLADIHRADGRRQTYTDASNDTINIEHDEQRIRWHAIVEQQKLWIHGAQRRDKKQKTCNKQRILTSQFGSEHAREGRTDDTTYQCRRRGEAMPAVCIGEITRILEESLKTFLRT